MKDKLRVRFTIETEVSTHRVFSVEKVFYPEQKMSIELGTIYTCGSADTVMMTYLQDLGTKGYYDKYNQVYIPPHNIVKVKVEELPI